MKRLSSATYFLAAVLVVVPAVDLITNVLPLTPSSVAWRYGTVGLLSGFLLTPLLGIFLACWTAHLMEHQRIQKILAVLNGVSGGVLLLLVLLFTLDAVQLRSQTNPDTLRMFDVGVVKAVIKNLLGVAALAWLAFAGWKNAAGRPARGKKRDTEPVLVRRQ